VSPVPSIAPSALAPTEQGKEVSHPPPSGYILVLAGLTSYFGVMVFLNGWIMTSRYGYLGFRSDLGDAGRWLVATACIAGISVVIPRRIGRPSDLIQYVLVALVTVPTIVVFLTGTRPTGTTLTAVLAITVGQVLLAGICSLIPRELSSPTARQSLSWVQFYLLLAFASLVLIALLVATVGLGSGDLGLENGLSARLDYRASDAGRIVGYATIWLAYVIAPVTLALGVLRRQWYLIGLSLVAEALVFSLAGFRSALLGPLAVLGAIWIGRAAQKVTARRLPFSFFIGISTAFVFAAVVTQAKLFDAFFYLVYRPTFSGA